MAAGAALHPCWILFGARALRALLPPFGRNRLAADSCLSAFFQPRWLWALVGKFFHRVVRSHVAEREKILKDNRIFVTPQKDVLYFIDYLRVGQALARLV